MSAARRKLRGLAVGAALVLAAARGEAAAYRFDEPQWTGAAGEVAEAGGGALAGQVFGGASTADAAPAVAGDPGSCRYGVFDGNDDYVQVGDDPALDLSTALTVAAWIRVRSTPPELYTIASKDTNYEYHVDSARHVYWWWNDSANVTRSLTTAATLNLDQWYHVAITYSSGSQAIYIDGVLAASASYTGTLKNNDLPFFVAADWNLPARDFDGFIDEVRVLPAALTQPQVAALRSETHPCPSAAAQFTINHDGVGIHCAPERIAVNVIDANAGTPLLGYNATVRLDTQTGRGTWTRVAGAGAFADGAADDGVATYTWPLGESQAVFDLSYPAGPAALDVDVEQVSDSGIRDTDAEGLLVFGPSGFTVTAAALSNPPGAIAPFATPQTAGGSFALHVAAYGQTPSDPTCGIIEDYTGAKNLAIWTQHVNPAAGLVAVTVDGVAVAASEATAAPQSVTFTAGQAVLAVKYKDVGALRIALEDDSLTDPDELPGGVRGATATFVVRPANFRVSGIAAADGTPAAPGVVDAAGPVFAAAGAPFRATVEALDLDGDPVPSYGRESPAETARLIADLVAPAGGDNVAVTGAAGDFSAGTGTGTDFRWRQVGIVRLRGGVGDLDYLGAGDVAGSLASQNVGRFVPHHFTAVANVPRFATACAAGGFTYQGQGFVYSVPPVLTATARADDESVTTNYEGAFFKLATATLANRTYTDPAGPLDTGGLPPADADPVVVQSGDGVGTLTFASGAGPNPGLAYLKVLPRTPFDAHVDLSIDVLDADGVAAANPVTVSDIEFDVGREIRYGRIRIANAVGSELVDLPVAMLAEYYRDGQGFVPNVADTCTTGVTVALGGFTENLAAGETCVRDSGGPGASGSGCAAAAPPALRFASPPASPLMPGNFNLRLAAPGAGNNGGVTIGATVPSWLEFDWNTLTLGDESPSGQATFGIYGGERKQIYTREIY